jgi:hypothetical protein
VRGFPCVNAFASDKKERSEAGKSKTVLFFFGFYESDAGFYAELQEPGRMRTDGRSSIWQSFWTPTRGA